MKYMALRITPEANPLQEMIFHMKITSTASTGMITWLVTAMAMAMEDTIPATGQEGMPITHGTIHGGTAHGTAMVTVTHTADGPSAGIHGPAGTSATILAGDGVTLTMATIGGTTHGAMATDTDTDMVTRVGATATDTTIGMEDITEDTTEDGDTIITATDTTITRITQEVAPVIQVIHPEP